MYTITFLAPPEAYELFLFIIKKHKDASIRSLDVTDWSFQASGGKLPDDGFLGIHEFILVALPHHFPLMKENNSIHRPCNRGALLKKERERMLNISFFFSFFFQSIVKLLLLPVSYLMCHDNVGRHASRLPAALAVNRSNQVFHHRGGDRVQSRCRLVIHHKLLHRRRRRSWAVSISIFVPTRSSCDRI